MSASSFLHNSPHLVDGAASTNTLNPGVGLFHPVDGDPVDGAASTNTLNLGVGLFNPVVGVSSRLIHTPIAHLDSYT